MQRRQRGSATRLAQCLRACGRWQLVTAMRKPLRNSPVQPAVHTAGSSSRARGCQAWPGPSTADPCGARSYGTRSTMRVHLHCTLLPQPVLRPGGENHAKGTTPAFCVQLMQCHYGSTSHAVRRRLPLQSPDRRQPLKASDRRRASIQPMQTFDASLQ